LQFSLSLVQLEIRFLPQRKQIASTFQRPSCCYFSDIITVDFDNNVTHLYTVCAKSGFLIVHAYGQKLLLWFKE